MALTDYDKQHLTPEQQQTIISATNEWNRANAVGDAEGMSYASALAAQTRAGAGYGTDDSGQGASPIINGGGIGGNTPIYTTKVGEGGNSVTMRNPDYTPGWGGGRDSSASPQNDGWGTQNGGGNGSYTQSPEIAALYEAKKQAAIAQLKAAVERQVSGYGEQLSGLDNQYNPLRAQSELERYKSGKALEESLANSGELAGGQGRQDTLNLQNAYGSNLNAINLQQQGQTDSLNRAIADARSQGELQTAIAGSQYDAELMQALLSDRYRWEDNQYRDSRDAVSDARYDQQWAYQLGRDDVEDKRYEDQWDYQKGRDEVADSQWDKSFHFQQGEADRSHALAEGQLTGWYKGLPTTAQQQIDIQFADWKNSMGQQRRENALQLLQLGMYTPELAKDAGMEDAAAQNLATYAQKTMDYGLEGMSLQNQAAKLDIANYGKKSGGGTKAPTLNDLIKNPMIQMAKSKWDEGADAGQVLDYLDMNYDYLGGDEGFMLAASYVGITPEEIDAWARGGQDTGTGKVNPNLGSLPRV